MLRRRLPPFATTAGSMWTSTRGDLYTSSGTYDQLLAMGIGTSHGYGSGLSGTRASGGGWAWPGPSPGDPSGLLPPRPRGEPRHVDVLVLKAQELVIGRVHLRAYLGVGAG